MVNAPFKIVSDTLGLNERPDFDAATFRCLAAEFIATFTFLFLAMGAGLNLLANADSNSAVSGIAVGLGAVAVIYSFGGLSGAHFNPAVTFGSMVGLRMNIFKGLMYIVVQVLAAFAATGLLMFLYPEIDVAVALTLAPHENIIRAVLIEMIMSFFLVMTIYGTALGKAPTVRERKEQSEMPTSTADTTKGATPARAVEEGQAGSSKEAQHTIEHTEEPVEAGTYDPNKPFAGLAIGFMLGCLCYIGGWVSGGAFNPARATAPAVMAGNIGQLWVYWVGDLLGALLAAGIYSLALTP
jgi:glycerol uptake facilitator-like aquaporin